MQRYVNTVTHLRNRTQGFHEPHAARTERARTVWRETLHTRLRSRLRSKRTARLSPSSSALFVVRRVCLLRYGMAHGPARFPFLCRDVTSCGSACTLPFLRLLDADLDVLERGGSSDFEGFLVFFLVFVSYCIMRRFVGVGVIRYALRRLRSVSRHLSIGWP